MKKIIIAVIAAALLLTSCNTTNPPDTSANPTDTKPGGTSGVISTPDKDSYEGLFNGSIIDVSVTLPQESYTAMLAAPEDEEYYQATVNVNGAECTTAGIRTRGNISWVTDSESTRYSYKINFGKYQKGTKVYGLDQLCLNNIAYDPSYIREYLTCMAFAAVDGTVPLAAFARLTVNGKFAGIYFAVEAVDDSFLNRVYGENDGSLYQAGKNATLLTADTSMFELENGDDEAFTKITNLIAALQTEKDIDKILDVSSVLKYLAVNAVIGNEDSYTGTKAQNYYFYEKTDGKLTMIPWDFNLAFGTDSSARKTEYTIKSALETTDVSKPYFGVNADQRPLCSVLLANSEYYTEYMGYIETLYNFMQNLPQQLTSMHDSLSDYINSDSTKFYTYDMYNAEYTQGEDTLLGFITARTASLKTQLGK